MIDLLQYFDKNIAEIHFIASAKKDSAIKTIFIPINIFYAIIISQKSKQRIDHAKDQ